CFTRWSRSVRGRGWGSRLGGRDTTSSTSITTCPVLTHVYCILGLFSFEAVTCDMPKRICGAPVHTSRQELFFLFPLDIGFYIQVVVGAWVGGVMVHSPRLGCANGGDN